MFPNNEALEKWFVRERWPNGVACPKWGSINVLTVKSRKPQPYRCRDCRKCFSVKAGTLMQSSNLGLQTWAIVLYILTIGISGTSSMKMHRDVGVTQKTASHHAHRIRDTWRRNTNQPQMGGPVEADETFIRGPESNKHESLPLHEGHRAVGKVAVAGLKDRATNRVRATVAPDTTRDTLRGIVQDHAELGAMVHTDGEPAFASLPRHAAVNQSVGAYVRDQVHTNGMESFWSMLKRGYPGTYHHMSPEHLDRYVGEFPGRHNERDSDTLHQMAGMVRAMDGKQLPYHDLVA